MFILAIIVAAIQMWYLFAVVGKPDEFNKLLGHATVGNVNDKERFAPIPEIPLHLFVMAFVPIDKGFLFIGLVVRNAVHEF